MSVYEMEDDYLLPKRKDPDKKPLFDFSINLGTIISLVGMLIALWVFSNKLESRITSLEVQVSFLRAQVFKNSIP